MNHTTLWMTGATGFVGSHLLYYVLLTTDLPVVALVRSQRGARARDGMERLCAALLRVAASRGETIDLEAARMRLTPVTGDITQPACGVSALEIARAHKDVVVWHVAASLRFEDRHRADIEAHNVGGTYNALALAERLGAGKFVYVSTAYTCGTQIGAIPEALHPLTGPFNNVYEQTKCQAEHAVAAWGREPARTAVIVRPSIVVGPQSTHAPGGSETGLYGFARELLRIQGTLRAAAAGIRMCGEAHAGVNLIPVDHAVSQMWSLASAARTFAIHHVTSDAHPDVGDLMEALSAACEIPPIGLVPARTDRPSPVEQAIDRRARFYSSYLRAPKTFARAAGSAVAVTRADLRAYLQAFVREERVRKDGALRRRRIVDGRAQPLVIHEAGRRGRPLLVFCNALGIPPEIWFPVMRALADAYHVVTWHAEPCARLDAAAYPHAQAEEVARLLDDCEARQAFLVGWCTGSDVAALFAHQHPTRVRGLVTINGALNHATTARTRFQRSLAQLVARAAQSRAHAALYHELLFGQANGGYGAIAASEAQDGEMLSSMIGSLDDELLHLTSAAFRSPDALHIYARAMASYYDYCAREPLPCVKVPVLAIAGARDDVAHPDASRRAVARWPLAQLLELPHGDHFAVYHDPSVPRAIAAFVRTVDEQLAAVAQLPSLSRASREPVHAASV